VRQPQFEITSHLEHLICDMLAGGANIIQASQAAGVGERTVRRWLARGRHPSGVNSQIYERFAGSVADAQLEHQARVREAIELAQLRRGGRLDESL
jgi:transposase